VAELVVHPFEVIDIAEHDHRGIFFPAGTLNFAREESFDDAAVPKRSKGIVGGLKAHAFARFNEVILEFADALSGAQPGLQFFFVVGLVR
jgi:hypothetical protein